VRRCVGEGVVRAGEECFELETEFNAGREFN